MPNGYRDSSPRVYRSGGNGLGDLCPQWTLMIISICLTHVISPTAGYKITCLQCMCCMRAHTSTSSNDVGFGDDGVKKTENLCSLCHAGLCRKGPKHTRNL